MCGRFYLTATPAEIRKQFKVSKVPAYASGLTLIPVSDRVNSVRNDDAGMLEAV